MRKHDVSLAIGGEGLTIHTGYDPPRETRDGLETHVEARKYACRADQWFAATALVPGTRRSSNLQRLFLLKTPKLQMRKLEGFCWSMF